MIRAFTGPSDLTNPEKRWVAGWVAALPPADEIRTGMAKGVDSVAALISMRLCPDAVHVLYRPAARHNADLLDLLSGVLIVECPTRATTAASYRIRNTMMVDGADELVAFVRNRQFYRSGEWMTINIAKKHNVKIEMVVIPSV